MIKRRKKIIKTKRRRNPYLANVGYHVTNSENLQSILDNGFVRKYAENYYYNYSLLEIADFFFEGRRPVYFLDIDNLDKITPLMKYHFEDKDLLLKVDVSSYDLQPDYNMLFIDYDFIFFDKDFNKESFRKRIEPYYMGTYNFELEDYPKSLQKVFQKYGKSNEHYSAIPLRTIKNNNEIKEELIFFTETFCVNEDIPPSKILEFYEIEK